MELKRVVKEIEKIGLVEIIGIDLMCGTTSNYYSNVIEVIDQKTLTDKLLEGVTKILKVKAA